MAARTGFEPVNAALRGLWLQPLAERAMFLKNIAQQPENFHDLSFGLFWKKKKVRKGKKKPAKP